MADPRTTYENRTVDGERIRISILGSDDVGWLGWIERCPLSCRGEIGSGSAKFTRARAIDDAVNAFKNHQKSSRHTTQVKLRLEGKKRK